MKTGAGTAVGRKIKDLWREQIDYYFSYGVCGRKEGSKG